MLEFAVGERSVSGRGHGTMVSFSLLQILLLESA
jgi:hypothetical protein